MMLRRKGERAMEQGICNFQSCPDWEENKPACSDCYFNGVSKEKICQETDCPLWEPNKVECDDCLDGRDMEVVYEYATTCNDCGELMDRGLMSQDEVTKHFYCEECAENRGLATTGEEP